MKPTATRCALRNGHEGPHLWVTTRQLGRSGECRAFAPLESSPKTDYRRLIHHLDGDPTNNALDNLEIRRRGR